MEKNKIHPLLKMALELGPIIIFFIGYGKIKDQVFVISGREYEGFIVATALFIPLILTTTAILWALTGKLSKMQLMTALLVVIFGGLGIWFNDERFFKMKPTILYLAFSIILFVGLLRGKSFLAVIMAEVMPLKQEGWMILTRRLALFFFILAVSNELVWRLMSTDSWVSFKTFVLPLVLFAFFISQSSMLSRYSIDKPDN
ncbi:MAG: septation protein IspZ [Paracoccaceae bacterium]|jgi:intracellular septation protein|nr:septation protein IspZ [Paracoccaceae bacterium]MDE2694217.1 septation protein IspZ [Paracoccaceae bacterium]|tara:strand:- start:111 stop:713 length:603 start_codon:yes stop_codon:yes gene_type:complete